MVSFETGTFAGVGISQAGGAVSSTALPNYDGVTTSVCSGADNLSDVGMQLGKDETWRAGGFEKNQHCQVPKNSNCSNGETMFLEQCKRAYDYAIQNFLYSQAVWYAERMVAECGRDDDQARFLLGQAYFYQNEIGQAYYHLQANPLPQARFLFAKCCNVLQKWEEAEKCLLGGDR